MKTDVCTITPDLAGVVQALDVTERCALYCKLNGKETLRLRLLAEELLGMMRGILGAYDAQFWLEAEEKRVALHLCARGDIGISGAEREQLLKASTTGENVSARGFMGKLRQLFEYGMSGGEGMAMAGSMLYTGVEYDTYIIPNEWSLQRYREMLDKQAAPQPQWDELERSIVASLADDVVVGVHGDVAEVTIQKAF